jgi:hypothetical protein
MVEYALVVALIAWSRRASRPSAQGKLDGRTAAASAVSAVVAAARPEPPPATTSVTVNARAFTHHPQPPMTKARQHRRFVRS